MKIVFVSPCTNAEIKKYGSYKNQTLVTLSIHYLANIVFE